MACAGGDHFDKKIESRDDWCHPQDTVTALPSGSTFQNPHIAPVLSGRAISNQGATVKELDAE